jgi:Phage derived protein Gp49-like (DUF891)
MVEVVLTDEALAWFDSLSASEQEAMGRLFDLLERNGVALGFPYSSQIKGSKFPIRELRHRGQPLRAFYAFDRAQRRGDSPAGTRPATIVSTTAWFARRSRFGSSTWRNIDEEDDAQVEGRTESTLHA